MKTAGQKTLMANRHLDSAETQINAALDRLLLNSGPRVRALEGGFMVRLKPDGLTARIEWMDPADEVCLCDDIFESVRANLANRMLAAIAEVIEAPIRILIHEPTSSATDYGVSKLSADVSVQVRLDGETWDDLLDTDLPWADTASDMAETWAAVVGYTNLNEGLEVFPLKNRMLVAGEIMSPRSRAMKVALLAVFCNVEAEGHDKITALWEKVEQVLSEADGESMLEACTRGDLPPVQSLFEAWDGQETWDYMRRLSENIILV